MIIPSTFTQSSRMYTSFFLVFAICIAVSNAGNLSSSRTESLRESEPDDSFEEERIVSGEPISARRFVGAIVYYIGHKYGGLQCTASLIAPDRVLTAAHCFPYRVYQADVELYFVYGLSDIREKSINRHEDKEGVAVVRFSPQFDTWVHESYVGESDGNLHDLAIIKLPKKITAPNMKLMRLAKTEYTKNILGVGWGRKNCTHDSPETLRQAKALLLSQKECSQKLSKKRNGVPIPSSQMCSYFRNNKNLPAAVSRGDSGGPLFTGTLNPIQTGVFSFGYFNGTNYGPPLNWRCINPKMPQIFTRVSAYEEWIKRHAPTTKFV